MRHINRHPRRFGPSADASCAVSDASGIPEHVRIAAEQHGLGKALTLFPDVVKAAAERGLKPLGDPPKGTSPIVSPAAVFDPARFERER